MCGWYPYEIEWRSPQITDVKLSQFSNEKEIGGRKGPEPTRYGDWEKNGRCIDF